MPGSHRGLRRNDIRRARPSAVTALPGRLLTKPSFVHPFRSRHPPSPDLWPPYALRWATQGPGNQDLTLRTDLWRVPLSTLCGP